MDQFRRFVLAVDRINRWIARRTGIYLIDVWLWRRQARKLDELALDVAPASPAGAVRLHEHAERLRRAAASLSA